MSDFLYVLKLKIHHHSKRFTKTQEFAFGRKRSTKQELYELENLLSMAVKKCSFMARK
jgi:hypothetical protein